MKRPFAWRGLAALLCVAAFTHALAHDAISNDARKAYMGKLEALQRIVQSNALPSARAVALFETGKTLDEIRGLLNEDVVSHGKPQGLETAVLIHELNTKYTLQVSPHTRLYLADLKPYRESLKLDPRGKQASEARFLILKNHFYDSFVDNPIRPLQQTKATLLEMIESGESLLSVRDDGVDTEEVHFILAIHYLQAADSGAHPKEKTQARFGELLKKFRSAWPASLKLATLEALSSK